MSKIKQILDKILEKLFGSNRVGNCEIKFYSWLNPRTGKPKIKIIQSDSKRNSA
jgi:hypothetical protein